MTQTEIVDLLKSRKGRYVTIEGKRQMDTYKDECHIVEKHTKFIARVGLNYDNLQATKDGRASGELPQTNAGLNGMTWSDYPYFLEGKGGKIYVRLYPVDGDGFRNMETTYTVDGVPATKEYALTFCTAKEKREGEPPACINYGIHNITRVS